MNPPDKVEFSFRLHWQRYMDEEGKMHQPFTSQTEQSLTPVEFERLEEMSEAWGMRLTEALAHCISVAHSQR